MNPQEIKKLEYSIPTKKGPIIVGVSGGPDSVFLLHILAQKSDKIIAAHLDHSLRKSSSEDNNFVRSLCESLSPNIKFESIKKDIKSIAKKNKKGLEETGRTERYKFFRKLAKKHQAKFITTAHHADDNLETILLNLTRGASLQGLAGMQIEDKDLFRPLIQITKRQILDYLKFNKIPYLTDETNKTDDFNRNLIRNRVIPHLLKINPNLPLTTAKNTKNLREIQQFLEKKAQSWLTQNPSLPIKRFNKLDPTLQKTILRQLHLNLTGTTKNLENTHIDEVLAIIKNNIGNKKKKLGQLTIHCKNGDFRPL